MNLVHLSQVTPVVLTYDEEPNIARTLELLDWAKEVVVVDSGSNDLTETISKSFPNVNWQVRSFDNHKAQWDYAINKTGIRTEYVLALDADMQVTKALLAEIDESLNDTTLCGAVIPFEYRYYGKALAG